MSSRTLFARCFYRRWAVIALLLVIGQGRGVVMGQPLQGGQFLASEESSLQAGAPEAEALIGAREYLKFKVSYSFFTVAWFEMEAIRDTTVGGQRYYHLKSTIWTNSAIPFIREEIDEYNTLFFLDEQGIPITHAYWKHDIDEGDYREYDYRYDRERGLVDIRENLEYYTLDLEDPATSGHLILLWARMYAGTDRDYTMNVYTAAKHGVLYAENSREIDLRRVLFSDREKQPVYFSRGRAEVAGPFGFSGDFEAWFLNTPLRVPVEVRLSVFVGHVKIRLMEYHREGEVVYKSE